MIVGIVIVSPGKRYSVSTSSVISTESGTTTISLPCVFSTVALTEAVPRFRPLICPAGLFTARIVGSLLCQVTALAGGVCNLSPSKYLTLGGGFWLTATTESKNGSRTTKSCRRVDLTQ